MNQEDTGKFKMKAEAAETDIYREEIEDFRVERLSHRLTLLSILIPLLLVVVLAVAYLDIKKRVSVFHSFGTTGVAKLSKDLDSRFSSLSLKLASTEEAFSGKLAALEKTAISLQAGLKRAEGGLKKLASAKGDKKELRAVAASAKRRFKDLNEGAAALKKDLTALAAATATEMDALSSSLAAADTRIKSLAETAAGLADAKVDQKELELALASQKKIAAQEMDLTKTGLLAKILPLEKQVRALKKEVAAARKAALAPLPAVPMASPAPAPAPPAAKKTAPSSLGTGKIIEQDIDD